VLDLLVRNEELTRDLYSKFSVFCNDAENKDFWTQLSDEEDGHATFLIEIQQKVRGNEATIDIENFPSEVLELTVQKLTEQISEIGNDFSDLEMLRLARSHEESILEKEFLNCIISDSVEVNISIERLRRDTNEHAKRLKRQIEKKDNRN
jgi:rubrerythrin